MVFVRYSVKCCANFDCLIAIVVNMDISFHFPACEQYKGVLREMK